jgi:branched-chain amino acid transport system substrate-binding protein
MIRKLIASAAIAVGLLGVGASDAQAQQTVKMGIIAPLTGPGASWGIAMAEAARMRAAEVNANGGIDQGGKKALVEIIAYDDQYKAAEALAAYNRLVTRDGVKNIIVLVSASMMALKQIAEDDKVIILTGAFASKAIDEKTKYTTRFTSVPVHYMPGFAAWMRANLTERRIAAINPNDETGWEQKEVTTKAFKEAGLDVIASELFERSLKDFQPLLTKLLAQKIEILDVGTTSPATAGLVVRQARELGYKGRIIKTGGPGWQDILDGAGSKENVEGMIGMGYADTDSTGYQRIAAEYKKKVGQEANLMLAPYYDTAGLLLAAMEKSGDANDTAKVAAALPNTLPFKSIQGGVLTYSPQQILTPIFLSQIKNGVPVIVGTVR